MASESFKAIITQKFMKLAENYLNTGNPDSYFSGHNGQLIDLMRTLEEDNKFNMDMLYKEGFFTKAVLDESIDNWATYLNYDKGTSLPSSAKMVLILSTTDDSPYRVQVPKNTQWTVGTIIYTLATTINIINFGNNKLFIYTEDGVIEQLPFKYVYNSGTKTYDLLVKKIPLQQYEIVSNTYTFPNITTFEHKSYQIKIKGGSQIFGIDVTVNGEPFKPITTFQDFKVEPKSAVYSIKGDVLTVTFGNSVLGYLPFFGDIVVIDAKLTMGAAGAVAAGDVKMADPTQIIYGGVIHPDIVAYIPENSIPGSDTSVEIVKANAIADFRTNRRFVTEQDFKDFFQLLGLTTPVFIRRTRADMVKTNVSAFLTIPDLNVTVAPTSTEDITIPLPVAQIENMVIPKGGTVTIDSEFTYSIPYELFVSTLSSFVSYRNRPDAPESIFKLLIGGEHVENNSTESFYSMTDANALLDVTYPLLGQDNMKYTIKFFHIFNDAALSGGAWDLILKVTTNNGTIIETDKTGDEFRSGVATLDTSGGGDLSAFLAAPAGTMLLDAAGVSPIAEFATNIDIGYAARVVKFNQGSEPPTPSPQIVNSFIASLAVPGPRPVSLVRDPMIRFNDYIKFDVVVNKNTEMVKFIFNVGKMLSVSNLIPLAYNITPLMDYSVEYETFKPLDIELLSSSSVSTLVDITINNVPLIETEYYEANLTDIDNFLLQTGSVIQTAYADKRMLNNDINIKFAKTYGKIKNIFLNQKDKIYTFDPEWNPRVFFDIEVFIDPLSLRDPSIVVEEIKTKILEYINDSQGYHKNIVVSKVQSVVQAIPEIQFVRIVSPVDNIIYSFDLKKITKNEMRVFVPEYIYTTFDSINITQLTSY